MEYIKFFITDSVEKQPKSSKWKQKKESAGRIFRNNLQQHLVTESRSDSYDGDNQSDLVPQAITSKKHTKKGKCKLVKLNLSKQRHAIILFIRYPRKLQDSKLNWFPFRNKKEEAEERQNFPEISKHDIKL